MIRLIDFLASLLALVVLSPIFSIIIIILKFTGEGEIFYLQERIGKNGNTFYLIKFVTMLKNSPNIGSGTITVQNDPRILPFGHFLRKSKINELLQLINVLKGDMSLVGPRPLTQQNFDYYSEETKKQLKRLKPGLSGIGSIVFRNEENLLVSGEEGKAFYKNVIAPYKGALETWYQKNQSLLIYFLLIFVTIYILFSSNIKIVWKIFKDLPSPPEQLQKYL